MRVSALALTDRAAAAMRRGHALAAQVAFVFNLNMSARVRETLLRRVVIHGRARWLASGTALTLSGIRGRNHANLRRRRALARGLYRLSLTPLGGGLAMTISFAVA